MRRPSDEGARNWRAVSKLSPRTVFGGLGQADGRRRRNPPLSVQRLMQLVDPEVAGDPSSDLRWIRRSLRKLQRALKASGLELAPSTIQRVLLAYGIRPKANVKRLMPQPHPDRDRQFRHIQQVRQRFERAGWPVISVDTKKKELVGLFKNRGQVWGERALDVYMYDFPDDAVAKAVPYGIYDVQAHRGAVYIGLVLLCQKKGSPRPVRWPPGGRCSSVHRWHTGQRGSLATRALVSRTRSVAIEVGLCRSGRSGGSAGFLTLG